MIKIEPFIEFVESPMRYFDLRRCPGWIYLGSLAWLDAELAGVNKPTVGKYDAYRISTEDGLCRFKAQSELGGALKAQVGEIVIVYGNEAHLCRIARTHPINDGLNCYIKENAL